VRLTLVTHDLGPRARKFRRTKALIVGVAVTAGLGLVSSFPAHAAPSADPSTSSDAKTAWQDSSHQAEIVSEQVNGARQAQLRAERAAGQAASALLAAKAEVAATKKSAAAKSAAVAAYQAKLDAFASASFRGARLSQFSVMLTAKSADDFLDESTVINRVAQDTQQTLAGAIAVKDTAAKAKVAADAAEAASARAKSEADHAAAGSAAATSTARDKKIQLDAAVAKYKSLYNKLSAKEKAAAAAAAEKVRQESLAAAAAAAARAQADAAAAQQAAADNAAADKSAAEKSAAEKSAAEKSAAEKSAAEKSAAEKSAAEKSAAEKSAAAKSAAEESAAEELAPGSSSAAMTTLSVAGPPEPTSAPDTTPTSPSDETSSSSPDSTPSSSSDETPSSSTDSATATSTEANESVSAPSEGGDAAGQTAAAAAMTKIGFAYSYAGDGPSSYDCSGLTTWAWAQAGVSIPRVSYEQEKFPEVPLDQLQPGDLVTYYSPVSHVAIYVGGGMVVSAADESLGVVYRPVSRGGPNATGHRVPRG